MKHKKVLFLILITLVGSYFLASQTKQRYQPWDGSQTTPVHLIPLKDEFDQLIIPSESYPLPYSTRYTCAPCHDYNLIQGGLHFNAASSPLSGRPGEPWVWVEPKTGTLLPLSYRDWKGLWKPQDLELTPWDFTLLFGRHMTGGGVSDPEEEDRSRESRWNVSGKLEINCLACHNASRHQNHSEWAKQVLRHNFRWAATATSGLAEVGGMASRLPGTWDIFDGPNPDDTEWAVVPYVRYGSERFDTKHRVFFDIAHKADDNRCLTCHSVSRAGLKKFTVEEDVHSAAGIKCVDCHRNDISHAMVRGYEGEAQDYKSQEIAEFTCQGCHIGQGISKRRDSNSGRLGAPYPRHSGIPSVHFERLSCTVCHAGSLPSKDLARVRTSRANRLGIYGIAQWSTEQPSIIEPVFVRNQAGKLLPHRLMWPAFWGRIEGEGIFPFKPSDVQAAAGNILSVEEAVVRILAALALYSEIEGTPVLIASGNVYEPNIDGKLDLSAFPGELIHKETQWAVKKNGKISPLVPDFDPDAEEPDAEIETLIQKILEALATISEAPGKPALIYKNALYQVSEGYLEKGEAPEKSNEVPRLVWLKDKVIMPLVSDFQVRTVVATVGYEQTLTEEQVKLILKSLSKSEKSKESSSPSYFFYISGGKMFRLDSEENLSSSSHPAAEPVLWPLGHQVRPAQQSLGINGCKDCHSGGSAFFFNKVKGTGPLQTRTAAERSGHSFMGLNKPYQKLFGLSFTARPFFKAVLFVSALVVGSMLFILFLLALGRYSGLIEKRR